jgi:hypothetical protein
MRLFIFLISVLGIVYAPPIQAVSYSHRVEDLKTFTYRGISHGSATTKGVAYAEALAKLPSSAQVYRRVTYGAKGAWTTSLFWKIKR